ncbi:hypothetical protein WMW72_28295 [Paenibacillus filicis]|uniref:Lipoprotein n=1 Tax=Paenibacillus filicis TaxID=669464 RepID=A0ABU9DSE6_9BACL
MKKLLWTGGLAAALILTGCGQPVPTQVSSEPSSQEGPRVGKARIEHPPGGASKPAELEAVNQTIITQRASIEYKHGIRLIYWGVGADHLMMEIRSAGDPERVMTEEEQIAVKETLYKLAGKPFSLALTVHSCCTQPANLSGTVKKFDAQQQRILVVHPTGKNGNTDDPEANWVRLESDGRLIVKGKEVPDGLDATLVGQQVEAWTSGMTLTSYPGQTSALKIVAGP